MAAVYDWFVQTLRSYPEIAVFLSLAIGYYVGSFTFKGLGLGAVTATLLAAVVIGQLDIPTPGPLKAFFFLMFLFAIGYGVGPQFVRGIAKDGIPQAIFAAIVCVFCLAVPVVCAKLAGYDAGAAAGLYAGSQTISASMGLATDAIAEVAEGDGPHGPCDECDPEAHQREQCLRRGRSGREEQRPENQRRRGRIDQEVVPFDDGADAARKYD